MMNRLAASLLAVMSVGPAQAAETVIAFDHTRGVLTMETEGKVETVANGDRLRVAPGTDLTVVVRSTNTALYAYSLEIEEAEAPEVTALRTFAPLAKTYLALAEPTDALLNDIACSIDTLRQVELLAFDALVRMGGVDSVRSVAQDFDRRIQPYLAAGPPPRLALAASIAEQMRRLNERILANGAEATDQARDLVASTRSLLDQVHAVEELVMAVRCARDTWTQHVGKVSASHERSISVSVRRRSDSSFAHLAERKFQLQVEPRWPVQPAVGVALVVSPQSEFATYDVDGSAVIQTGSTDARVTYGLALALTPARFYGEERGVSFWLLDMTLNPTDNVRAFGLGSALSWNIVKLSAGFLWTKHQEVEVGEIRESYGRPELYVGVGLAGWLN